MPGPAERERQVAALLDAWPWEQGGVVIGGYAVAAYGAPRYSDDIDLVVPVSALPALRGWLAAQGFLPDRVPPDLEQDYAGKVARWRRGDVALDLLPGVVRDRDARADVPERWIAARAHRRRLLLIDASTRTEIPVARPEAFWALKLQAGRPRDLADLFAIHQEPADLGEVRELFEGLWSEPLAAKLALVARRLEDARVFADTMSRLSRGRPSLPANAKAWAAFTAKARSALPRDPAARRAGKGPGDGAG